MALRGAPFYMVGRMEGQSVVLRAEKGELKLELSDPQNQSTQELGILDPTLSATIRLEALMTFVMSPVLLSAGLVVGVGQLCAESFRAGSRACCGLISGDDTQRPRLYHRRLGL